MNTNWNDPEKYKQEVEHKLEQFKEKEKVSTNKCTTTSNKRFRESTNTVENEVHCKNKWFYISDADVRECKIEEAIDNKHAYVLLYEKIGLA